MGEADKHEANDGHGARTVPAGGSEPDTSLTAVVGIASAIVLFVVVVFLQAFFYHQEQDENARKVVAVAPEELSELRAQQQELLRSCRFIDPKQGVVAIPIERAMELVVREGGTSTPAPGYPRAATSAATQR
jgi:hypothetical protein